MDNNSNSDFIKILNRETLFFFSKKGIRGVSISNIDYSKRRIEIEYVKGPSIVYDNIEVSVATQLFKKINEEL